MAVTKTIIKLSNTEAVIRISGIAGDTATIILDSDLLLPLEYLNNDPIKVNIGAVSCSGITGGYASLIRNNVTILNVANKSLDTVDLLGEPFVPDSINNTDNIVVTITGQQSQVYIYLKKVSGFTSTDTVIDSAFNVLSLFGAGEQGAWYDPSDFQPNWRRNLQIQSQTFQSLWTTSNCSIAGNTTTAPDATTTASTLTAGAGIASIFLAPISVLAATSYTSSIYVKQGTSTWVLFNAWAGSFNNGVSAWVNTSTGVIGTTSTTAGYSVTSSSVSSAGNEWYRVSITWQATSSTSMLTNIRIVDGDNLFTFTTVSGLTTYIWGAQLEQSSSASTYQKITDGIQDYYTVQPQPVLFQDSAGTIPVTAVEQPVGLMLDKSKGLALGAELVTNGDFSNGTTGWSANNSTITNVNSQLVVTATSNSPYIITSFNTAAGITYFVSFTIISRQQTGSIFAYVGTTAASFNLAFLNAGVEVGTRTLMFVGTGATVYLTLSGSSLALAGDTTTFDNISVKQIAGNHAFQGDMTTGAAAKRPMLSARVNILLATATLSTQSVTSSATNYTLAFAGTGTVTLSGTATGVLSAGTNTFTATAGTLTLTVSGSVALADLRPTNSGALLPPYQRVNTASDYNTVGFPLYLKANGTSSAMSTNSIDYTTTNTTKLTIVMGVRSEGGGNRNIFESSANAYTTYGGYSFVQGGNTGSTGIGFLANGPTGYGAETAALQAPYVNVFSLLLDEQATSLATRGKVRINSVDQALPNIAGTVSSTGSIANYPLYLFARNNTSLFLNGNFYGAIIRGATTDQTSVVKAEKLMATKTGITF